MEEEEEVDIVGGYDVYMSKSEREISYISSGQILSCDYTVHPLWLTDNSDGTELWPDNFPKQSSQDEMEMVQDEVVIEEPAPIDFDWCEETSNCGDLILEQDIPTTIEEEVITNSGTEAEDDQYNDSKTKDDSLHERAVAKSGLVSLAKIRTASVSSPAKFNPRSLLKVNYLNNADRPPSKFRKTLLVNKTLLKSNAKPVLPSTSIPSPLPSTSSHRFASESLLKLPKNDDRRRVPPASLAKTTIQTPKAAAVPATSRSVKDAPKFRQTVKLQKREVFQSSKMRMLAKIHRPRMAARKVEKTTDRTPGSGSSSGAAYSPVKGGKGKRGKKFVDLHGENITINHDVESGSTLVPRKSIDLPISSRVISVLRNDSDDDLDVDIESGSSPSPPPLSLPQNSHSSRSKSPIDRRIPSSSTRPVHYRPNNRIHHLSGGKNSEIHFKFPKSIPVVPIAASTQTISHSKLSSTLNRPPSDLIPILDDPNDPSKELRIDINEVSALEKYFHAEFFEGRATKTPERYVKIRNFIVQSWQETKPSYVSKTTVRTGLKHCGDVNCISRIHNLLEQIGAINFGCNQVTYVRPMRDLVDGWFTTPTRNKQMPGSRGLIVLETRPRTKSGASSSGGGEPPAVDANYTVSHEDGTIVLPNVRQQTLKDDSSDDDEITSRAAVKPELQLIKCLRFSVRETPAPFQVSITLSTLMCLQLHSLSAPHEVMGFLGGHRSRISGKNKFSLTRYKPCQTSAQSGTMCEMCPVSQVQQSDSLITEGYDLLGWFHSHPTFPPNPSRTDVATQADMQLQFSIERPFIGFIMSCIDTNYKCMYIMPEDLLAIGEHTVPYELEVEIIKDCSNFKSEIADVFAIIDKDDDQYAATLKKFASYANPLLQQYGYGKDILSYLNNRLY